MAEPRHVLSGLTKGSTVRVRITGRNKFKVLPSRRPRKAGPLGGVVVAAVAALLLAAAGGALPLPSAHGAVVAIMVLAAVALLSRHLFIAGGLGAVGLMVQGLSSMIHGITGHGANVPAVTQPAPRLGPVPGAAVAAGAGIPWGTVALTVLATVAALTGLVVAARLARTTRPVSAVRATLAVVRIRRLPSDPHPGGARQLAAEFALVRERHERVRREYVLLAYLQADRHPHLAAHLGRPGGIVARAIARAQAREIDGRPLTPRRLTAYSGAVSHLERVWEAERGVG